MNKYEKQRRELLPEYKSEDGELESWPAYPKLWWFLYFVVVAFALCVIYYG